MTREELIREFKRNDEIPLKCYFTKTPETFGNQDFVRDVMKNIYDKGYAIVFVKIDGNTIMINCYIMNGY
jgi:hypothetical protein